MPLPGFALYRALLRQIPRISLPTDLTSRSDWIHPITYLIQSGFRRNKADTSPRLVTSALQSGYRFLTLLVRAQDTSSASHAEVVTFLRDRQKAFPPPRPPPDVAPPKLRPTPLLVKVSEPGQRPVYKPAVRPLPLSELSGGTRKVPVFDDAQGVPFLRISKPESHSHANLLKRKALRRQGRITAFQELWEERRHDALEEDLWEATLEKLASREGVKTFDVGDNGDPLQQRQFGSYEWIVREYGVNYLSAKLRDEMVDMQARATALLDLRDEEQRLADLEKREKKAKRRAARGQKARTGKHEGSSSEEPADELSTLEHEDSGMLKDDHFSFRSLSKDDWAEEFTTQGKLKGNKTTATRAKAR